MIKKLLKFRLSLIFLTVCTLSVHSQTYNLVWEDNFDGNTLDSSTWNVEERVGIWNTAQNAELQFYKTDNVSVGDDGQGNNCLIISALKESANGYSFTSGRVNTNTKFSFKYGKLEARIKIPDLKNGLWPAFWTEGFTSLGWPDMGEIDILEMGHKEGIALDSANSYVASATHWEYNNNRADYSASFMAPVDLSDDYHLVTMIWTSNSIKTYLDETNLIFSFSLSGADQEEFKNLSHFILINLAVGGILPGITTVDGVTAPFPAKMYIDYIKLYQVAGAENFTAGPHVIAGDFGVFSENNLTANMNTKFDSEVVLGGLDIKTLAPPYEGVQSLAYNMQVSAPFSMKVNSLTDRNMSNYTNGSLNFMVKTNFTGDLILNIADTAGVSSVITLNQTKFYNPTRDNTWNLVTIPIVEFIGNVDFTCLRTMFGIEGTSPSATKSIEVDNIIWKEVYTGGLVTDQYYGLFVEKPEVTNKLNFATTGHLYVWNGFTAATATPLFGKEAIGFNANTATWNGFGLQSDDPINLSGFLNGYLNFFIKTNSSAEFSFGFKNLSDKGWEIKYAAGATTSAFKRDNKWHLLTLPLKSFPAISSVALTADALKDITTLFYLVGSINFSMDEIYYSRDATRVDYGIFPTATEKDVIPEIQVFPVPARDIIFVKGVERKSEIAIYSLDGKLIQKIGTNSDINIDLSGFQSGIYLLNVSSDKENFKKKFVVE